VAGKLVTRCAEPYAEGDLVTVQLDMEQHHISFYKNGVLQGAGDGLPGEAGCGRRCMSSVQSGAQRFSRMQARTQLWACSGKQSSVKSGGSFGLSFAALCMCRVWQLKAECMSRQESAGLLEDRMLGGRQDGRHLANCCYNGRLAACPAAMHLLCRGGVAIRVPGQHHGQHHPAQQQNVPGPGTQPQVECGEVLPVDPDL
jgi:hypothetical protein